MSEEITVTELINENALARMKPFLNPDAEDGAYETYLKGKTVVIIGGKSGHWRGFVRATHDVTLRVNDHIIRQRGGSDILYHTATGGNIHHLISHDWEQIPKFVMLNIVDTDFEYGLIQAPTYAAFGAWSQAWLKAKVGFFAQGEWLDKNPYGAKYEWLNEIHREVGAKLFTGFVALADILRYDIKSVYVTACDFYKNEVEPGQAMRHSHGLAGNAKFLEEAQKDPRVTFCADLERGLEKYFTNPPESPPTS